MSQFSPIDGLPGAYFAADFLHDEHREEDSPLWNELQHLRPGGGVGGSSRERTRLSAMGPLVSAFSLESGEQIPPEEAPMLRRLVAQLNAEETSVLECDGNRDGVGAVSPESAVTRLRELLCGAAGSGAGKDGGKKRIFQASVNLYDKRGYGLDIHVDSVGSRVAMVSLGSAVKLDLWKAEQPFIVRWDSGEADSAAFPPDASVLLTPGSALVLTGESFAKFAHGIEPRDCDDLTLPEVRTSINNFELLDSPGSWERRIERESRASIILWT